jgi:signal transduction histidine kinase
VIALRSAGDVVVLATPRSRGLFWALSALGLGVVCGGVPLLWVRRRNEAILREHRQHLRHHAEERERIGKDLHDNIMQSIYAVGLGLEECRRLLTRSVSEAEERLEIAIRSLNSILQDVRHFIGGLEPRAVSGAELKTALKSIALTAGETSDRILIQADPNATRFLTPRQATHLLNIAKEAISNSLRHAQAHQLNVSILLAGDHVRLEVSDDGVGFDPVNTPGQGNGLANMAARARELGARMDVTAAPGQGTRVRIDLPVLTIGL